MTYKLFLTDFDVPESQYRANKSRLQSFSYVKRDDALGMALRTKSYGGVPWEIEGDDGTAMSRSEIDDVILMRRAELSTRPNVY
jgi:hypothetical protein